ncbi:MAG: hypothetical protein ACK51N_02185 [bacterium]|nr:hypothetical protein [Phycisphaerales bacterium]MCE2652463.1 hypothetical protein [Planctomycetaceae bacterium]
MSRTRRRGFIVPLPVSPIPDALRRVAQRTHLPIRRSAMAVMFPVSLVAALLLIAVLAPRGLGTVSTATIAALVALLVLPTLVAVTMLLDRDQRNVD